MDVLSTWQQEFDDLVRRIRPRFARSQSWGWTKAYLRGLLSDLPRKNSWQLAESLGEPTP